MNPAAPITDPVSPAFGKRLVPWLVAIAFFMKSRYHHSEHCRAHYCGYAQGGAAEHEIGAVQLHPEPRGLHPISGWMANRFGTRRGFAFAIGLFTLGSLLCGIFGDIRVLLAWLACI